MSIPAAPDGWTRYVMKSKLGLGRAFSVLEAQTEQVRFEVVAHVGVRPRCEIFDADGRELYRVRGQMLAIPKRLEITDAADTPVATLKAKAFSPVKSSMTLEVHGQEPWSISGKLLEKNYSIVSGGTPVVAITQKWLTVRDKYTVDVADGTDAGLALAVLWGIDRWVERD